MDPKEKNQYKESIINSVRNNQDKKTIEAVKFVLKDFLDIEKDTLWMYQFFSEIYDNLFYDIVFEKIRIENKTKNMLETLATPLYKKSETEQEKIIKKFL